MKIQHVEEQARFWSQVQVIGQSNSKACWLWTGAQNSNGYGVFGSTQGLVQSHRYAAGLTGSLGPVVMHVCDNPACVRPSHLATGTQKDNMQDMCQKSRKNSKLTIQSVQDIRSQRLSRAEFAKLYNISEFTVGQVQRGETWAWLKR